MHDDVGPWDSQDKFWDMVNPRDDGSCLVVDRQYAKAGTPFGVRQVQCSSQSANFACQKEDYRADDLVNKDQESDEERVRTNCDLPYCSDLEYCGVNKNFSAKTENGDYLLIKPNLLGTWKTSCGVRYLMSDKIMDWRSAMNFCCSLGMNIISVQSQEKLNCLDNILENNVVYWTSGTNGGCANQRYRWCSSEFKDFIKPSVNLRNSTLNFDKNGERANPSKKYCVILKKSETEGPILGIDLCTNMASKSVICEARVMAESHLQEIFNECKMTHRLTQRDIAKFSSSELDTFSYKMKCLMTCMAELLGLLYDSGKLWVDSIEKAMRRVKQSQVLEDFRSLMKKYPTKLFKKAADNLDALKMMVLEQNKEQAWKSTLFVNEALDRFWECTRIVQFNTSQDECFFIHNFIKCFTNETASLGKFWNMNLHNIFDSREYVYTMRKSLREIEEMVENANIFTNPDPISKAPRDNLAFVNKISYTEEFVSSKCINHYLRPKNLTDLDACTALSANFMPIAEGGNIRANIFIDKKFYSPLVAAAMCERANGSLVTAEELNTGEIFSFLDNAKESIGNPSQKGFGAVLLDEYFVDSKGEFRWCSTSAVLPQELQNIIDKNQYNLLFSSIDQYFFTFVDDDAADSQLFFCKFDSSFLSLCDLKY
ncbi:uncharacterized protein LOC135947162 [Cloeon dipterum]|uniref:uncharacterized protein LOC135947162 n=1 Tax=Cloeon dipterum TaxID=197152 RepID=UPI0032202672